MNIWTTPERQQLRKTVRAFAEREILPHVDEWERIGELPRGLHRLAGAAGLLGAGFPEAVGGGGGDGADPVIICEEMHQAGAPGGVYASLFTCGIAVPHMVASGDERLIATYVRRGQQVDEAADAAMRAAVEGQIEAESLPLVLSGMLYDDGVIDPRDTRTVLGMCLSAIANGPIKGTSNFGVFRM